jgi:hypothetical protein
VSMAVALLLLLQVAAAAGETILWKRQYTAVATNHPHSSDCWPGAETRVTGLGLVGTVQISDTRWMKSTCTPGGSATFGFYSDSAATTLMPGTSVTTLPVDTCSHPGDFINYEMNECKTVAQVLIWKIYTGATCNGSISDFAFVPLDTCVTKSATSSGIYNVVNGKLTLQYYPSSDCSGTATGGDIAFWVKSQCPAGGCPVDTCLQSTDTGSSNQLTIRGAAVESKTSGAAATIVSGAICALASLTIFFA